MNNQQINTNVHTQLGQIARQMHEGLSALGLSERLHGSMNSLPDASDRLEYISTSIAEAADKVLNHVEGAKARQTEISEGLASVLRRLGDSTDQDVKTELTAAIGSIEQRVQATSDHLTEIMVAQHFHDLTHQVMQKVIKVTDDLERQLIQLLVQTAPEGYVPPPQSKLVHESGPVMNAKNRDDVASKQEEVDDFLASLGF